MKNIRDSFDFNRLRDISDEASYREMALAKIKDAALACATGIITHNQIQEICDLGYLQGEPANMLPFQNVKSIRFRYFRDDDEFSGFVTPEEYQSATAEQRRGMTPHVELKRKVFIVEPLKTEQSAIFSDVYWTLRNALLPDDGLERSSQMYEDTEVLDLTHGADLSAIMRSAMKTRVFELGGVWLELGYGLGPAEFSTVETDSQKYDVCVEIMRILKYLMHLVQVQKDALIFDDNAAGPIRPTDDQKSLLDWIVDEAVIKDEKSRQAMTDFINNLKVKGFREDQIVDAIQRRRDWAGYVDSAQKEMEKAEVAAKEADKGEDTKQPEDNPKPPKSQKGKDKGKGPKKSKDDSKAKAQADSGQDQQGNDDSDADTGTDPDTDTGKDEAPDSDSSAKSEADEDAMSKAIADAMTRYPKRSWQMMAINRGYGNILEHLGEDTYGPGMDPNQEFSIGDVVGYLMYADIEIPPLFKQMMDKAYEAASSRVVKESE